MCFSLSSYRIYFFREVRKTVLEKIKLPRAILDIVKRCRDIEPSIRIQALEIISENVNMTLLPPETCVHLLLDGLKDPEEAVFDAVIVLLKTWYKYSGCSMIKVLRLKGFLS